MSVKPVPIPFVTPVAGVSFRQDVVVSRHVGERLVAVAVDDNEHDSSAVEVRTTRGEVCGFVPAHLAGRLRAGGFHAWDGEIVEVLHGDMTGLRVKVIGPAADIPRRFNPGSELPDVPEAEGTSGDVDVFALSGRRLGRLCSVSETSCTVIDDQGRRSTYPLSSVADAASLQSAPMR